MAEAMMQAGGNILRKTLLFDNTGKSISSMSGYTISIPDIMDYDYLEISAFFSSDKTIYSSQIIKRGNVGEWFRICGQNTKQTSAAETTVRSVEILSNGLYTGNGIFAGGGQSSASFAVIRSVYGIKGEIK